ncbi:squalene/phytoene synthase family protein [Oceanobacillus damuensis]|uniref:squalene/phytoene synthase family protein n=1 Tax=Oceanobacillus damuensis TaxID=937928 RepID=UPI0008339715|nr:phytoene/squalene synthase family protein [Oceanobacillus damuensis]
MSNQAKLEKEAMHVLKLTSRTFYIPIKLLNSSLKKTVGSAYLCMRAIDEIEDHEQLDSKVKQQLLMETSNLLKTDFDSDAYEKLIKPYQSLLPEVTLRLGDWLEFCPSEIVGKVKESTSEMAEGMAKWVERDWVVHTKEDLDEYTYYVAGLVGVMLSDIWKWYDGTETDRELAIGYGRGLQAVNILRNKDEDAERGVRFFPDGWTREDMFVYAEDNLNKADQYMKQIDTRNIILFCKIPLALAHRTLKALKSGKEKMSRKEVETTVDEIINE